MEAKRLKTIEHVRNTVEHVDQRLNEMNSGQRRKLVEQLRNEWGRGKSDRAKDSGLYMLRDTTPLYIASRIAFKKSEEKLTAGFVLQCFNDFFVYANFNVCGNAVLCWNGKEHTLMDVNWFLNDFIRPFVRNGTFIPELLTFQDLTVERFWIMWGSHHRLSKETNGFLIKNYPNLNTFELHYATVRLDVGKDKKMTMKNRANRK